MEWALLSLARDLDRFPTHNTMLGVANAAATLNASKGKPRRSIEVAGFDPLKPPEQAQSARRPSWSH